MRQLLKDFAWDRVDKVYAALLNTGIEHRPHD